MKRICSFLLVIAIVFAMTITANAGVGSIKLSSDKTFLHIGNADTMPDLSDSRYDMVTELYFTNCVIDKNLSSRNTELVEKITFEDCEFKVRQLRLPEDVKEIIFEEALFKNMSFANVLSKLKRIKVYKCSLDNLEKFSSASNLEELVVNYCSIGSLKGIEGLKSLTDLNLDFTKAESIDGVEKLGNLDFLSMKSSSVRDISAIKNLKLTYLNVDNCVNIENLDAVTELPQLEDLFADNCEMAATEKLVNFLKKNSVSSNLNKDSLKIKNQVENIYKSIIKKGMTKEEIIGTVVKYVCNKISYDKKADSDNKLFEEYNDNRLKYALAGKGNSANYTTLTTALLQVAGVKCYEMENEDRFWNIVELDGNHYWLDTAEIDEDKVENINDSSWFMRSGKSLPQTHDYISLPSSVYADSASFTVQYKPKKDFVLGETPSENKEEAEEEEEEEVSAEDESLTEETTVPEETEVTTQEETTKYERPRWYTETFIDEDEGKTMGKVVVSVFAVLAVAVGAFFIVKRRRQL